MHMVGPYLTTTNHNGDRKKMSNSAKVRLAKIKHDTWLRERGVHPEQLEMQKASNGSHKNLLPDLKVNNHVPLSNNLAVSGGYRNSVLDNLHHETENVRQQILDKAKRIAPAFSKGAYQYITPGADLTDIGKKK